MGLLISGSVSEEGISLLGILKLLKYQVSRSGALAKPSEGWQLSHMSKPKSGTKLVLISKHLRKGTIAIGLYEDVAFNADPKGKWTVKISDGYECYYLINNQWYVREYRWGSTTYYVPDIIADLNDILARAASQL